MLFITVKYLAPTLHKGSRFKAIVEGNPSLGSITKGFAYELSIADNAKAAAQQFSDELAKLYGFPKDDVMGWEYTGESYLFVRKSDMQTALKQMGA